MTTIEEMYGGNFLTGDSTIEKGLVGTPLTIYATEKDDSFDKESIVIQIKESTDKIRLNKTSAYNLMNGFGKDWKDGWKDKKITLTVNTLTNGNKSIIVKPLEA